MHTTYTPKHKHSSTNTGGGIFQRKQKPQPYSLTNPATCPTGHFCLICATKIRSLSPMLINKIISFPDRSQTLNTFKLIIYSKIIV